ncbi:MAG TPA: Uma2 family endonuclease [Methylomirabilota bacterium]|jgi:Uma2 family endonuclease
MSTYPIRTRRWTRREYHRLIELGILHEDEPIELLGGQLVVSEPKSSLHSTAVRLVAEALRRAFGAGWLVNTQDPIAAGDESEPEPDVAVVPGSIRDYRDEHPANAALVVEVALTSLAFDRRHKGSLYARAGVGDYWIVNLIDRIVEVRRRPAPDPAADYGAAYQDIVMAQPGTALTPFAKPDARIAVDDVLP